MIWNFNSYMFKVQKLKDNSDKSLDYPYIFWTAEPSDIVTLKNETHLELFVPVINTREFAVREEVTNVLMHLHFSSWDGIWKLVQFIFWFLSTKAGRDRREGGRRVELGGGRRTIYTGQQARNSFARKKWKFVAKINLRD